jgi:hypothetical protein
MKRDELEDLVTQCHTRTHLIAAVIKTFGYTRYLEIGCRKDETFSAVSCVKKVGIDPIEGGTHRMTSDEFFDQDTDTFDCVFIDGDHHHTQVLRDALHALARLSQNGTLILHDCSPPDALHEGKRNWKCGTAWRAFAWLRQLSNLDTVVADWDYGSGLVRFGHNPKPIILDKTMNELTFADFEAHRTDWMKLCDRQQVAAWLWDQKQRAQARV